MTPTSITNRRDDLYSLYLDAREATLNGAARRQSSRDLSERLAVYLGAEDAHSRVKTCAELRDELERCLCTETKVDSAAAIAVNVDLRATDPDKMVASLTTPIEPKVERPDPAAPKTWEAERSEEARRDDVLRAAARELLATDPTNGLLDSTLNLIPAHEIRLARLRHAIAQAKRESAGSRTQCANRWIAIAATLGIDPAKDPPTDIAGFIDPHGPGSKLCPMRPQPLRFQDPRALRELFAIALPTGYRLDCTADSPPLWAWASETDAGKERTSIGMAVRHAWDHANGRLPYPQS